MTLSSPSILEFCLAWPCIGLVHAVYSMWVHVCTHPIMFGKHYFAVVIHYLQALTMFLLPLLQWHLRLGRRECNTDGLFNTEHSTVSYFLHVKQLWISVLITIFYKKRSFYDEGWEVHWSTWYKDKYLGRHLIIYSFKFTSFLYIGVG